MTISLGLVVAEFNRDLTYQMELLGREHAEFLGGATVKETILVPGGFLTCPLQSRSFAREMTSMPWLP